jgi:hypothetical protein
LSFFWNALTISNAIFEVNKSIIGDAHDAKANTPDDRVFLAGGALLVEAGLVVLASHEGAVRFFPTSNDEISLTRLNGVRGRTFVVLNRFCDRVCITRTL